MLFYFFRRPNSGFATLHQQWSTTETGIRPGHLQSQDPNTKTITEHMGKSRRNRGHARTDPIAKPVKPPTDPELAALREAKILPVIKDLKSLDIKSRTTAANAIANIATDSKCRKLLLREQVVHIVLTETLTDNNPDGRAAGWEILKVLAQEEEADFCVHLYRLDVLTAIEHAAKLVNHVHPNCYQAKPLTELQIIETLTAPDPPFTKRTKAEQRLVWNMASSLLTLLSALALARDEILNAIVANQTILRFLLRLAATASIPADSFEEALTCLMTLTEDNIPIGQAIIDDQETRCYDELLKLKAAGGPKAVFACGVLHNVFSSLQWLDHSPGKDGACDAILVPSLSQLLEQLHPGGAKAKTNGHSASSSGATQVALEILASIGTDLGATLEKGNRSQSGAVKEEDEWNGIDDDVVPDDDAMEVDGGSEDGDNASDKEASDEEGEDLDSDIDIEADMDRVTGHDEHKGGNIDDLPTLRELIHSAVPQLIRLTNIPVVDDEDDLEIQSHAFSALNNIAWTLSCIEFANGENTNIFAAWAPAAKKIWLKTIAPVLDANSNDLNLATLVTGLAWAVSKSLNGETPVNETQHLKFMMLYQADRAQSKDVKIEGHDEAEEQEDPFQSLGVKCIGVLGSLARNPAPLEVNKDVGKFFMKLLNDPATPLAEVIEASNQVFDIYGDEEFECEKVFWEEGLIKHLEDLLPQLKTRAKGVDKRKAEELRTKTDEAILNLGRFIKYKKKHAPKERIQ